MYSISETILPNYIAQGTFDISPWFIERYWKDNLINGNRRVIYYSNFRQTSVQFATSGFLKERKYLVYVAAHYIRLLPDNFGSFIYHEQVGNWNRTRQLKSSGFKVLQRGNSNPIHEVCDSKSEKYAPVYCIEYTPLLRYIAFVWIMGHGMNQPCWRTLCGLSFWATNSCGRKVIIVCAILSWNNFNHLCANHS